MKDPRPMARPEGLKVRPLAPSKTKDVFKIFLSPANLQDIKIGSICNIASAQGLVGQAIAWNSTEKILDDVVQMSRMLQTMYGLTLESRISISPSNEPVADALDITLLEVPQNASESALPPLNEDERPIWEWVLSRRLKRVDLEKKTIIMGPGLLFEHIEIDGERRSFKIQRINSSDERILYRPSSTCKVRVQEESNGTLFVSSDDLGGLGLQMQRINRIVAPYSDSYTGKTTPAPQLNSPYQGGILIYGASGTGKSLVLSRIAEAGWRGVFRLNSRSLRTGSRENGAALSQIFDNALRAQPSIIIIDSIDKYCIKDDTSDSGSPTEMGELLCDEFDRLRNKRVLVVAAARSLEDVDKRFRRLGRLTTHIEIPTPDLDSRREILRVIHKLPKDRAQPILEGVAALTSGFVGGDLRTLQFVATQSMHERLGELDADRVVEEPNELDYGNALIHVRPEAMNGSSVQIPDVSFDDIAGHDNVKEALKQAVVWPLKYPNKFKAFKNPPAKGLLLYGPPGCSKTMAAKAAAATSGSNFIVVNGSELDIMYVGESERALREIFRRARSMIPCMVFFDEIDAIGAARGRSGQHGGVKTVETLLIEMDGFQKLDGVFVLAATNRPDILDPGLLRGGRFGKAIYVGLPDENDRREMFRKKAISMPIDPRIDIDALVDATDGFSGADVAQICAEAGYAASSDWEEGNEPLIGQQHFAIAMGIVQKTVTPTMVERYKTWSVGKNDFHGSR